MLLVENALITAELSESDVSYDVSLPIKVFGGKRNLFQIILPTGATVTPDVVTATDANGAKFEIHRNSLLSIHPVRGRIHSPPPLSFPPSGRTAWLFGRADR